MMLAVASLALVATIVLGAPRQQRPLHAATRGRSAAVEALRAPGKPRTPVGRGRAAGFTRDPCVLALVLVSCRGPSRRRRGAAPARIARRPNGARLGRARYAPRRTRSPGARAATVLREGDRLLAHVGGRALATLRAYVWNLCACAVES